MLELLQFSILDMTPYDRQSWFNLVGDYNRAIWPAYSVALLLTLVLLRALYQASARPLGHKWGNSSLAILAIGWIWTGAIFHMKYFSELNWAAAWFGWGFLLQGALLLAAAVFMRPAIWVPFSSLRGRLAFGLLFIGLFLYPLSGFAEGRSFIQLEWFPLLPTPITLVTFAGLILLKTRLRHALVIIPIAWALITAAFAIALGLLEIYFLVCAIILWGFSLFIRP